MHRRLVMVVEDDAGIVLRGAFQAAPRVHQRSFTLRPMIDLLGGDFVIPGHHETLTWLAHAAAPLIAPTDFAIVIPRAPAPAS